MMMFTVLKETWKGKSLGRILTNLSLRGLEVSGETLEVGRGHTSTRASYWRYLKEANGTRTVTLDSEAVCRPDVVADICGLTPFEDGKFNTVLCFNLLEHLAEPEKALGEMGRVLAAGGSLIGSVPFMVAVHGDPRDYRRFTAYALESMLRQAGFSEISIRPIGGPCLASYAQIEIYLPRLLRCLLNPIVSLCDGAALRRWPKLGGRVPVDYVFSCTRGQASSVTSQA